MLTHCVVQTKYTDGKENIPWRNTKNKNFVGKKFYKSIFLLMKYKAKWE